MDISVLPRRSRRRRGEPPVRWPVVAAVGFGAVVARLGARRFRQGVPADAGRWQAVTVNVALPQLDEDDLLLGSLSEVADDVEVDPRVAPGGKGTELRARSRSRRGRGNLRQALRDAKQLLEVGEVLHGQEPSTSRRTMTNAPIRAAERSAKRAGLS